MSFGLFSFAKLPRSRTWFFSKMEAHSFSAFKLCTLCGMVNDSKSRLCINDHYSPCSCFPPISLGLTLLSNLDEFSREKKTQNGLLGVFFLISQQYLACVRFTCCCSLSSGLQSGFWSRPQVQRLVIQWPRSLPPPQCVTLTPSHCAI